MKKYVLTAIMGVLFCIGLTSMVSLSSPKDDPINCKAFCTSGFGADLFSSRGECMSTCNVCANPSKSDGNQAVCLCKVALNFEGCGTEEEVAIFGQCVNTVKDRLNEED